MTVADTLIDFIEGLIVPNGRRQGEHMVVLPFQRRFLRGAFGQSDDAALTVARGAGKTTLTGAVLTAALVGPLAQENAESVLVASSFEQSLIGFRLILSFMRPWVAESVLVASSFEQSLIGFRLILSFMRPWVEAEPHRYRVQDSVNRASITDRHTGASVRVLGSDPKRLHGLQANLLLLDEVAQWPSNQIDAMIAALETSRGKIPDSRLLWIGTRPAGETHPFAKALKGGVGYSQVHAARPDDPPFQRRTWLRANPGLSHFPDLEKVIRIEAKRAKADPSRLASFKALRLNMGTSDVAESLLLPADTWARCEGDAMPAGPYILGLDLGGSYAQSAASAYWPQSGRLDAFAVFPAMPDLEERGLFDGVGPLYSECARRGELMVMGQRTTDIPALLEAALARIHRMTALGTAHEEARGCSSESGIMVLEQKPARKQGAPNRCCHRTNPTVSASSLTTIAWWPMPACSCRPPSPGTWACENSSTITLTSAARRDGRTRGTRC